MRIEAHAESPSFVGNSRFHDLDARSRYSNNVGQLTKKLLARYIFATDIAEHTEDRCGERGTNAPEMYLQMYD